jgi:membrane protease YdiL (CAAX protease family)
MTDQAQPVRRLPILVCLGLILVFPLFTLPVQGATAALSLRIGEIPARVVTEGAIWLYGAIVLGVALFAERRTLASIGLSRPTFWALLWGLGAAVALLAIGGFSSFLTYNVFHQHNRAPAAVEAMVRGSLVYALCLAIRAGVIEEILYRGLAIEQLTALTGRRSIAALGATLLFIVSHELRFDLKQIIPIALTSFGLVGLYLWRRNLWINIIAHTLIDAVALGIVALHATSLY